MQRLEYSYIMVGCSSTYRHLNCVRENNLLRITDIGLNFLFQRSFIDFFEKRVDSGQRNLTLLLHLYLLFLIVDSLKVGICLLVIF